MGERTIWLTKRAVVVDLADRSASDRNLSPLPGPSTSTLGIAPKPSEPGGRDRLAIYEDFVGANSNPKVIGNHPHSGAYNYFNGSDPSKWHTHVRGYGEVVYRNVWDGIDVRLYTVDADLEREFIVSPGADPNQVKLSYDGVDALSLDADGSLLIRTAFGDLRESRPQVYQEIDGRRVRVEARFQVTGKTSYTFEVGPHRRDYALVIDPLLYSTYLGGSAGWNCGANGCLGSNEYANGIAVDSPGSAYVTGITASTNFPTTPGAYETTTTSTNNIFVTKLDPLGSTLVYSTYLGGPSGASGTPAIAVDSAGEAYVIGAPGSGSDFPTTSNALQTNCASNIFFTKLTTAGDGLVYSTCFGGDFVHDGVNSSVSAVAVDAMGQAYLTGYSNDLPLTPSAVQSTVAGNVDAFVAIINPSASGATSLVYSTYLGGSRTDEGTAIAVDSFGAVYVTGYTISSDFPVTLGAYQTAYNGASGPNGSQANSVFVAKFNPSVPGPSGLIYATYLGGTLPSVSTGIAVDSSGSAYVTGSTGNWPATVSPPVVLFPSTTGAAFSCPETSGSQTLGFVTKLNAGGARLVYSTCLSGASTISGAAAIALDSTGDAYVTGSTRSPSFPVTPDAFESTWHGGGFPGYGDDGFVTKLNSTGSALIYSSFIGSTGAVDNNDTFSYAIAVDAVGDAYVTGVTASASFPVTTPFAYQPVLHGTADAFITKFPLGAPGGLSITALFPTSGGNAGTVSPQIAGSGFHAGVIPRLNCGGQSVIGTNVSVSAGGRLLNTTFNLTALVPGTCDVMVTNPDGTSATFPGGFTVQPGGAPNIRLYLTGVAAREAPSEVAVAPTNAVVFATVSNAGGVDAANTLVSLPVNPPFSLTSVSPSGLADLTTLASDSNAVWNIPLLSAGSSQVLAVTATTASSINAATIEGGLTPTTDTTALFACFAGLPLADFTACKVFGVTFLGCGLICNETCTGPPDPDNPNLPEPPCTPGFQSDSALCMVCMAQAVSAGLRCQPAASDVTKCLDQSCNSPAPQSNSQIAAANTQTCTISPLPVVAPSDPNSLFGPAGTGAPQWVAGARDLTYEISFGNDPTASAPAQQVVVTQPLGPNVNLSSLTLLPMTIPNGNSGANVQISVPANAFNPAAGANEFTTTVDLRPTQSLLVSVDALLNTSTQTLTWTLGSIDPATGQPPLNPLVGFLPPGIGGNVAFTVDPTQGLATGTQISDQAAVVFNANAPLSTPTWINTIDNTPPVSQVSALPSTENCTAFPVSWSGSDVGSGLQGFTIYVSDSGGPFTPWLSNTTTLSANYPGTVGQTYSFYSIATDNVGNVEGAKSMAEASTTVIANGPCGGSLIPSTQISTTASGLAYSRVSQTFNGTVTITNISGSAITGPFQIVFTSLPNGVTLNNPTGTFSGNPYITVPAVATLAPGQPATVSVQFKNPSDVQINFMPVIYSGSFN